MDGFCIRHDRQGEQHFSCSIAFQRWVRPNYGKSRFSSRATSAAGFKDMEPSLTLSCASQVKLVFGHSISRCCCGLLANKGFMSTSVAHPAQRASGGFSCSSMWYFPRVLNIHISHLLASCFISSLEHGRMCRVRDFLSE
jgi:hypothetical protein